MDLHAPAITTAPVPAAAVVLLRESAKGPEVLLLQRHRASPVLGGAHVFPGGKVDVQDAQRLPWADQDAASLQTAWRDVETLTPIPTLGTEGNAESPDTVTIASYLAALREIFEEAGLLFATFAKTEAPISATTLQAAHERQRSDEPLARTLHDMQLKLHTRAVHPWARWITPVQGAISPQRFDTRFFIAAQPPDQDPIVDGHESMQSIWLRPRDALVQYAQGQLSLAPPQIMSLVQLLPHRDVPSALAAARTQPPVLIQPEAHTDVEAPSCTATRAILCMANATRNSWDQHGCCTEASALNPPEGWADFGAS